MTSKSSTHCSSLELAQLLEPTIHPRHHILLRVRLQDVKQFPAVRDPVLDFLLSVRGVRPLRSRGLPEGVLRHAHHPSVANSRAIANT
jgi:hypothetical protein